MHKLGFESKASTLVPPGGFENACFWKLMKTVRIYLNFSFEYMLLK